MKILHEFMDGLTMVGLARKYGKTVLQIEQIIRNNECETKTLEYELNCKTCKKKSVLYTSCWVTIQDDAISCGYCGYIMELKDEEES